MQGLRCGVCSCVNSPKALFCQQCGSHLTESEGVDSLSSESTGERKPVAILFTDIVGSLAIAEKLDPEKWEEIDSGAHQRVSQVVSIKKYKAIYPNSC